MRRKPYFTDFLKDEVSETSGLATQDFGKRGYIKSGFFEIREKSVIVLKPRFRCQIFGKMKRAKISVSATILRDELPI